MQKKTQHKTKNPGMIPGFYLKLNNRCTRINGKGVYIVHKRTKLVLPKDHRKSESFEKKFIEAEAKDSPKKKFMMIQYT